LIVVVSIVVVMSGSRGCAVTTTGNASAVASTMARTPPGRMLIIERAWLAVERTA
jgi:hypothetical protein